MWMFLTWSRAHFVDAKRFWQIVHTNGLSPVCVRSWICKSRASRYDLAHIEHANGLMPECVRSCLARSDGARNIFPHRSQAYVFMVSVRVVLSLYVCGVLPRCEAWENADTNARSFSLEASPNKRGKKKKIRACTGAKKKKSPRTPCVLPTGEKKGLLLSLSVSLCLCLSLSLSLSLFS